LKKLVLIALLFLLSGSLQTAFAGVLSEQQQQELLDQFLYMRGEGPMPDSFDESAGPRCGTELALNLFNNRESFTGKYAAAAEALYDRPNRPFSYESPAGYFRVHYATTGSDAVYLPLVDDDSDGIPDYVNKIAEIADSVWEFEVNHLGFPAPPPDDTNGGDSLKDIYITGLSSQYYGITYYEDPITIQSYTSYMELDNDYNFWPYNLSDEMERRLDAARVTVAHEFFHTIHYAMDATEFETHGAYDYVPWWEMSAVWMEEMAYDDINDYQAYLPYYYEEPWLGLQHAIFPANTVHQYACVVFPLYLTERFDTSMVKDIWERCALQTGPQYLQAIYEALLEYTSDEYDFDRAFNEFAVWNLFTGSRIDQAPAGYSFEEAVDFHMIPDSSFLNFERYDYPPLTWPWPDTLTNGEPIVLGEDMPITFYRNNMPQNAATHYINLKNLSLLSDTAFNFIFVGGIAIDWTVTIVGFPLGGIGQAEIIDSYEAPIGSPLYFQFDPRGYRNVVVVATPVDTVIANYPDEYGYAMIFNATPDSVDERVLFSSPYPNPIEADSPDNSINFKATIATPALSGLLARMQITIFTISGEKVKVINENGEYLTYYNQDPIIVDWDLNNESGNKVAPGVYMVYCHVSSIDGTIDSSEKYKIAIIR